MTSTLCEGCGEHSFLIPLRGGKGGPLRCPLCVGKWNAEHGRRRRTGRIVIRAIKAFFDAGGKYSDIDKLKLAGFAGDLKADFVPERTLTLRPRRHCEASGEAVKSARRNGARFCSDTCRQRAHRAVTAKNNVGLETLTSRDNWAARILALLDQHGAVFLNDLLPTHRTRAQYQALCLTVRKLEDSGKIDTWSYWERFGKPGHNGLPSLVLTSAPTPARPSGRIGRSVMNRASAGGTPCEATTRTSSPSIANMTANRASQMRSLTAAATHGLGYGYIKLLKSSPRAGRQAVSVR